MKKAKRSKPKAPAKRAVAKGGRSGFNNVARPHSRVLRRGGR